MLSVSHLCCFSRLPADKLDVNDGDYYRVKSPASLPPLAGWTLAKDGILPAPTLQPFPNRAAAPSSVPPPPPAQPRGPKLGSDGQEMEQNFEGEDIPGAYYVTGAAIPHANGVYARDGTYSGAPLFKKRAALDAALPHAEDRQSLLVHR